MESINPKILLVDSGYPINSRNGRIISTLKQEFGDINIGTATWNRQNIKVDTIQNLFLYDNPTPIGNKIEKLKKLRGFSNFIDGVIKSFAPDIIIASHWDSLLLCHKYAKKGIKVIYENLDMPSGPPLIRKFVRLLERLSLNNVSAICHASRFFKEHYKWYKGIQIIIENYPNVDSSQRPYYKVSNPNELRIVFNGGLRYSNTMIKLIEAVGNVPNIKLDFWGGAVGKVGLSIVEAGEKYSNITFHGSYKYEDIINIMNNADILWAVYPSENFNVKYAISNKFHESLFYGIPGVYSVGTKLGKLVQNNEIGFVVDDTSIEDIKYNLLRIRDNKNTILSQVSMRIVKYRDCEPINWQIGVQPLVKLLLTLSK